MDKSNFYKLIKRQSLMWELIDNKVIEEENVKYAKRKKNKKKVKRVSCHMIKSSNI